MFVAWGDESGSNAQRDPGAFLLGAVIAAPDVAEVLRDGMVALKLPSEKKVHWRVDSAKRHMEVVQAIGGLPLEAVVVVRVGPTDERPERRRRKCFEVFAAELETLGCTQLTMESRGRSDDSRDRKVLDALRRSKRVGPGLRLDHTPGPADAALWIADAVCGAVVEMRCGDRSFFDEIGRVTKVIEAQA